MNKYKNVRARKARICTAYAPNWICTTNGNITTVKGACIGVKEPIINPPCKGYCCKCTEYEYKRGFKHEHI